MRTARSTSSASSGGASSSHAAGDDDNDDVSPRADVEIVSVDCTEPAPGTTAGGLNEQLVFGGRFAQPSVTLLPNAPPCAYTVT